MPAVATGICGIAICAIPVAGAPPRTFASLENPLNSTISNRIPPWIPPDLGASLKQRFNHLLLRHQVQRDRRHSHWLAQLAYTPYFAIIDLNQTVSYLRSRLFIQLRRPCECHVRATAAQFRERFTGDSAVSLQPVFKYPCLLIFFRLHDETFASGQIYRYRVNGNPPGRFRVVGRSNALVLSYCGPAASILPASARLQPARLPPERTSPLRATTLVSARYPTVVWPAWR